MGIAFSYTPVYYGMLNSTSATTLLTGIDSALRTAGWTVSTSGTAKVYQYTTPQGLAGRVKIWDNGAVVGFGFPAISVQILDDTESVSGLEHHLIYGTITTGFSYEILTSKTWCFITFNGVDGNIGDLVSAYSVCFGGAFLPSGLVGQCAAPKPNTIYELTWSNGSGDGGTCGKSFRNSARCYDIPFASASWSYIVNGAAFVYGGGVDQNYGVMQYYELFGTYNPSTDPYPFTVDYTTHLPIFIDAFIGWTGQIQGQIYDAMVATGAMGLDNSYTSMEVDALGNNSTVTWHIWCSQPSSSLLLRQSGFNPSGGSGGIFGYAY
jgi:hypothetical protein